MIDDFDRAPSTARREHAQDKLGRFQIISRTAHTETLRDSGLVLWPQEVRREA